MNQQLVSVPKEHLRRSQAPAGAVRVPLNYVAPRFGDPDYEILGALHMKPFAVDVCEEKIREFYEEACEVTVQFHRRLATLPRYKALRLQEDFDRRMKHLADDKRREWKEMIEMEVRRRMLMEEEEEEERIVNLRRRERRSRKKSYPRLHGSYDDDGAKLQRSGAIRNAGTPEGATLSRPLPNDSTPLEDKDRQPSKSLMRRVLKQMRIIPPSVSAEETLEEDNMNFNAGASDETGSTIEFARSNTSDHRKVEPARLKTRRRGRVTVHF